MIKFRRYICLSLVYVLLTGCLIGDSPGKKGENVFKTWSQSRKNGQYVTPVPGQLERFRALFEEIFTMETFQPGTAAALKKKCEALGMVLDTVYPGDSENNSPVLIISEQEDRRHGRGFYMFRTKLAGTAVQPVFLQAPHRRSDKSTGEIVFHLFLKTRVRAAAFNTVHRKQADLAHLDGTVFQECTRAYAKRYPDGRVIQVHGFTRKKRKTRWARTADFITGNGTRVPSRKLAAQTARLGKKLNCISRLFPYDVAELGGTTNAQGKALRSMNHNGFVHIEIAPEWRKKLVEDKNYRRLFGTAFQFAEED